MKEKSQSDIKDYYNAGDICDITGKSKSLAYEIIRSLQSKLKKDFPEAIVIQGLIPRWYFEKQLKNKGE